MGIRRRIMVGFVSLASLLFLSGVISVFELQTVTGKTEEMLQASADEKIKVARDMLYVLNVQNLTFMQKSLAVEGATPFDTVYNITKSRLNILTAKIIKNIDDSMHTMEIHSSHIHYVSAADKLAFGNATNTEIDFLEFQDAYYQFIGAIENYIVGIQQSMREQAFSVGESAYRAIMPGILALGVGIVILFIFLYMLDIYFARPLIALNRGLKGYLNSRLPFKIKMEGKDEMLEMKDQIDSLIELHKKGTE